MGRNGKRVVRRRNRPMRAKKTTTVRRRRMYRSKKRSMKRSIYLGPIIPDTVLTKFRAVDAWQPTAAIGGSFTQFYANNPYDPVVGLSSTECSGFDAMMAIYERGICYACKVEATFLSPTYNQYGFVYFTDSTVSLPITIPNNDYVLEIGKDIRKATSLITNYNRKPATIKYFRTIKSLENQSDLEVSDYSFTGSAGPSKACGVAIGSIPLSSTEANAVYSIAQIRITYYCKLFDRKDMSQ